MSCHMWMAIHVLRFFCFQEGILGEALEAMSEDILDTFILCMQLGKWIAMDFARGFYTNARPWWDVTRFFSQRIGTRIQHKHDRWKWIFVKHCNHFEAKTALHSMELDCGLTESGSDDVNGDKKNDEENARFHLSFGHKIRCYKWTRVVLYWNWRSTGSDPISPLWLQYFYSNRKKGSRSECCQRHFPGMNSFESFTTSRYRTSALHLYKSACTS